jgi:hypothetical protein
VSTVLFTDDENEEIAQARRVISLAHGTGNPTNLVWNRWSC